MRKRRWQVEWRAVPDPDGFERLGTAVKILLERAEPAVEPASDDVLRGLPVEPRAEVEPS